jgi:integrase
MPRRRSPPRLYLDPRRRQWTIRDGASFIRTGCAESDRRGAEGRLAEYLGTKYRPASGPDPLINEVLLAYGSEHLAHKRSAHNGAYILASLSQWWGDKKVAAINARTCRAYAEASSTQSVARANLEILRAAIKHWHREHGPLPVIPAIVMPPAPAPRERWLTRQEAARLLRAARQCPPYLARMVLLGIYTGSRMRTLLALEWDWIDLVRGTMRRRAPGTVETKKRTPPVKLGRRILAHLRRWRRMDDSRCPWVCHFDGRMIDYPYESWRKAVKLAGLGADVTPHTLRHTRGSWLLQQGVPIWEASGHLGASPQTLARVYGHHSPDWQKRAAEV